MPKGGGPKGGKPARSLKTRSAFSTISPEAAFTHFRALAAAVPKTDLTVFTGQPLLMLANANAALERVDGLLDAAASKLEDARPSDVRELPSLILALDFAQSRVPVVQLSAHDIERMLREGLPWRQVLLDYLEVASSPLVGLLPAERVAAIRAGHGKLDSARDFVALAGLFTEFAGALAGKHPFTQDKIDALGTLGAALLQQIRPGRAAAPVQVRSEESVLRDQFASLVEDRYEHLQLLATIALGKKEAAKLPALRSAIGFDAREAGDDASATDVAATHAAADGAPPPPKGAPAEHA
jgi:hypothetical protein